jgi:predicted GIY-YIG superfamily endonuclease
MNIYYIYIHTFSNGIKYIGKGKNSRVYRYKDRNPYWTNLFNKYGKPKITFIEKGLSEEEAFRKEIMYIASYRFWGIPLCNFGDGGEGNSGWNHSEATKQKMSNTRKGKKQPSEWVEKRAKSNRGKTRSQEFVEKMRQARLGTKLTQSHKNNISNGLKGGTRPSCMDNTLYKWTKGDLVEILTRHDFSEKYSFTSRKLSKVINGARKSYKGWTVKKA